MAENSIIVESRAKDYVKKVGGDDFRTSGEFVDALNDDLKDAIERAVKRAKDNGRKTVQAHDL
jgi:histone H3/H4